MISITTTVSLITIKLILLGTCNNKVGTVHISLAWILDISCDLCSYAIVNSTNSNLVLFLSVVPLTQIRATLLARPSCKTLPLRPWPSWPRRLTVQWWKKVHQTRPPTAHLPRLSSNKRPSTRAPTPSLSIPLTPAHAVEERTPRWAETIQT